MYGQTEATSRISILPYKDFFKKFVFENNLKGIDRIVPSGQGLSMTLRWDGYDLNQALSRIIDLK